MIDANNLHSVKTGITALNDFFKKYLHACDLHLSELTPGEEMDEEQKHHNAKQIKGYSVIPQRSSRLDNSHRAEII